MLKTSTSLLGYCLAVFTSFQTAAFPTNKEKGFTKVLVTTGFSPNNQRTEIIDLRNPNAICPEWPDFPIELWLATGALLDNVPVICGGNTLEYSLDDHKTVGSQECFALNGTIFQSTGNFSYIGASSGGVAINDTKLWMTGGGREDIGKTEFITKEGISSIGPKLPRNLALGPDPDNDPIIFPMISHSMTNINSTTSVITGGYFSKKSDPFIESSLVYYYHHQIQKWIEGPKMKVARGDHASGMVTDTVTNEKYLVVAGGLDFPEPMKSTEILINNKWIDGDDMLKGISGHTFVPFGDSLVLLGGKNNKEIYKLTCSNRRCSWTKMEQELSMGREHTVAIPIPDSLAKCGNT